MASAGATLQLPSFLKWEAFSSSSSSSSLFMGIHLTFSPPPFSGKDSHSQKRFFVLSTRVSGLEEAMSIRREQELNKTSTAPRHRPPLRCGKVSPRLPVPDHIQKPPYTSSTLLPEISSEYQVHDPEGIVHMRAACELAAQVLEYAGTLVMDGDIINIDVTVYLDGYHRDTSKTFLCCNVNEKTKRLVKVAEECLERGIAACKDGALFWKTGKRIRYFILPMMTLMCWIRMGVTFYVDELYGQYMFNISLFLNLTYSMVYFLDNLLDLCINEHADKFGYGVADRFVGHGVGTLFHSEPLIFHHRNDRPGRIIEGQTFIIETILTLGSTQSITWEDNWTTLTADGSPSAQFEHTILITRTGPEILTKC